MEQAVITMVVSIFSSMASITAIITFLRNSKNAVAEEGNKSGALQSDLSYIKNLLNDVKAEVKGIDKRIELNTERIAKVEESVRQAHKRLNQLENKFYKGGEE